MSIKKKVEELIKAKELLLKYNYQIIDMENNIVDKEGVTSIKYNKAPKKIHVKR